MNSHAMSGDLLFFAPGDKEKSWYGYALDEAVIIGEMLEHPNTHRGTPFFYHCGIMLSSTTFAQENGVAAEAALSDLSPSTHLWLKRLPLTYDQRLDIPEAARAIYGERYDFMLDVYLGARYLWHGASYALQQATGGLINVPAIHIGEEEVHRFNCSSYDATVLRNVGYKGLRKRFYSPEGLAIDLPGPLWRIQ